MDLHDLQDFTMDFCLTWLNQEIDTNLVGTKLA
jgi:hypothetical protein